MAQSGLLSRDVDISVRQLVRAQADHNLLHPVVFGRRNQE
jgi:hypothetical protein